MSAEQHRPARDAGIGHAPFHVFLRMPVFWCSSDGDVCCPIGIIAVVSPGVGLLIDLRDHAILSLYVLKHSVACISDPQDC